MKALGVIFSGISDNFAKELTARRAQASVPFGGRYRLIDFVLSNMVNSGIITVGVVTQKNYQSLMDHIGGGKHWDLSRKNGGVIILPPFAAEESRSPYTNRLEALKGITAFFKRGTEEYVVLSDCDAPYVMDYDALIERHIARGADITTVYKRFEIRPEEGKVYAAFDLEDGDRVKRVNVSAGLKGMRNVYLNITCLSRRFMIRILDEASAMGYNSFSRDVLARNAETYKIRAVEFTGYYSPADTLQSYFRASMDLLDKTKRDALFNQKGFPVYTKVRDSAPTRYGSDGSADNSLIADGCVIDGRVENSVIFRGAKVGEGAVVRNSVLMQDASVSRGASVSYVIADKNAYVKEKRVLAGCEALPYYIAKDTIL